MPDPKTYKQVEGQLNLYAEESFNFVYFWFKAKFERLQHLCFRSVASRALKGFAKEGGDVEKLLDDFGQC